MNLEEIEVRFLLDAVKNYDGYGHTRDTVVRKLKQVRRPLSHDDAGILKPLLEKFSVPHYDEDSYIELLNSLEPKNIVAFLRHVLCTYSSTTNFLIDCIKMAEERQREFDK